MTPYGIFILGALFGFVIGWSVHNTEEGER